MDKQALIDSIYNKHTEIHYNQKTSILKGGKKVKTELQGKVRCPILNKSVTSITCAKLMDEEGWPRHIDKDICTKASCFIYLSIQKYQEQKREQRQGKHNTELVCNG